MVSTTMHLSVIILSSVSMNLLKVHLFGKVSRRGKRHVVEVDHSEGSLAVGEGMVKSMSCVVTPMSIYSMILPISLKRRAN